MRTAYGTGCYALFYPKNRITFILYNVPHPISTKKSYPQAAGGSQRALGGNYG